jgi:hypothetical protein
MHNSNGLPCAIHRDGSGFAYFPFYICNTSSRKNCGHELPCTCSCSTSGTSTIYWPIFTRPAMWFGRFLWKKGDGFALTAWPDGVSARADVTRGGCACKPAMFITTPLPC